ncbi:MAG: hypothetical protein EZS28_027538 [Streblomastix strix]|uniref:Uncharacterized protein n=1 Tax=Streblomastix strix TaxID=222440 RepID=A0A5J4V348_9EUKA|nr:MAG: hypothetical protein EZS28_027538 [Streblomastix strix]
MAQTSMDSNYPNSAKILINSLAMMSKQLEEAKNSVMTYQQLLMQLQEFIDQEIVLLSKKQMQSVPFLLVQRPIALQS